MSKDYEQITKDINDGCARIREGTPALMQSFAALSKAATEAGALDKKTKELVALAIGVATHCDGCIGFHTRTLARLGATRAEIIELLGVTVYMGGGPSLMYAADAIRAFDQFSGD